MAVNETASLTPFKAADKLQLVRLTIDIPDALAKQVESERANLVEVIRRGLREPAPGAESAVEEVIQFLARRPKAEEIVTFNASEKAQERLRELLEKNRANRLTEDEEAELDTMETLNELFALVKLQARRQIGMHA